MNTVMQIRPNDTVAVAMEPIKRGDIVSVEGREVTALEDIRPGHKIAIGDMAAGDAVTKYGFTIGRAREAIAQGAWVHTHNMKSALEGTLEYKYEPMDTGWKKDGRPLFFDGYVRKDGRVGIRNQIFIVVTVGCVSHTATMLADMANKEFADRGIDGVIALTHPYGCGQMGEDFEITQIMTASMVKHPNAGGVLVLSLGCEYNHIGVVKKNLGQYDEAGVRFLATQDVEDEIEEGLRLIGELVDYAEQFKREKVPVEKLIVGMKCGGSDGFSGLTANPLLGAFSDKLTASGGTTILTEVPEMFGAETILMNRAVNEDVFDKVVLLINNFKEYLMGSNMVVYENPSPGNKEGGISSLEDKSLGCVQKSGISPVCDVKLNIGDVVTTPGLNLIKAPGFDLVACSILACAGAQMILFTSGRGTPFGGPVPTMKIASNTEMATRKKHWVDFNAGRLLEGVSMDQLSDDLLELVLDVASGHKQAKAEEAGYFELSILRGGVTL